MTDTAAKPGLLSSFSPGDILQALVVIGSVTAFIVTNQSNIAHEGELRRQLEAHTVELVASVRQAQIENNTRSEGRFDATEKRDKEQLTELRVAIQRLSDKLETVQQTTYQLAQQQRQPERNAR